MNENKKQNIKKEGMFLWNFSKEMHALEVDESKRFDVEFLLPLPGKEWFASPLSLHLSPKQIEVADYSGGNSIRIYTDENSGIWVSDVLHIIKRTEEGRPNQYEISCGYIEFYMQQIVPEKKEKVRILLTERP